MVTTSDLGSQDPGNPAGGRIQLMTVQCFIAQSLSLSPAGLGCTSDWRPGGRGFEPRQCRQHSFVEIDHVICSAVILSLPLIQEGHAGLSGSVGCAVRLETRRSRVQPLLRLATFFRGD